jgi:hypothetical protein
MKENINVELNAKGEKAVLHIYEGKLPDPENRNPILLSGNINAPSEFWLKRNKALSELNDTKSKNGTNYDWSISHVIFDHSSQNIKLVIDEGSQREITVIGLFVLNPIFKDLGINDPNKSYESHQDLYRALKFAGHIFKTKESHLEVLKQLQNFSGKIVKTFNEFNDNKGNAGKSFETVLDGIVPLDFDISTPIFSGESKVNLRVIVEVQERNNKPTFYLTCLEFVSEVNEYMEAKFETLKGDFADIAIISK